MLTPMSNRRNQAAAVNAVVQAVTPAPLRGAVAALQTALPVARTILRAARSGQPAARSIAAQTETQARGRRAFGGSSVGRYTGRFRRPRRKLPRAANVELKYARSGYSIKRETHGGVADPHCVYLGTSTYDKDQITRTIIGAAYRKLFTKAGIPVPAANEIPALQDPLDAGQPFAGGFKITLTYLDSSGVATQEDHFIADRQTFESLVVANPIYNTIRNSMDSRSDGNRSEFERLALYLNIGGAAPFRLMAELNLKQEHIDLHIKCSMVVQNRTKSAFATGNQDDSDRVDTQPLKGWLYNFSSAVPEHKTYGVTQLKRLSEFEGMMLVRSEELPLQYREPPHPKFWGNCIKQAYVKLEPGEIKRAFVTYSVKGSFSDVVNRKLAARIGTQGVSRAFGRSMLFAMEERLNSGSTNRIELYYESERFTGCILKSRKQQFMLSQYEESSVFNPVA